MSSKKSIRTRTCYACCCLTGLAMILMPHSRQEPSYHGRSLSSWVAAYDEAWCALPQPSSLVTPRLLQAQESIRRMAPDAIPLLIDWMHCERPKWKDSLLAAINKLPNHPVWNCHPTTPLLGNLMEDKYRLAILGFRALGPDAASAAPALTPLMVHTNQKVSNAAIVALTCIGQKGLPAFLSALTNDSAHNRNLAAANIGSLVHQGFELSSAVPPLIKALDDPDRWVPANAAHSLGEVHLRPDISVPALKKALQHPHVIVRIKAAEALAKFPDQRETGISALRQLLQDTKSPDSFRAYLALSALTNAPAN